MAPLLPLELQQTLRQSCPGRGAQINQLATFYNVGCILISDATWLIERQAHFPSPPLLVAYGLEGTNKLRCITSVLEARQRAYVLVQCADCLSQRHLLSKIFAVCIVALGEKEHIEEYGKIDTLNSLVVNLQKLFERTAGDAQCEKLILVLNGIDEQRGGTATLLPSLARLPDLMPDPSALSLIMVSSSSRPVPMHKSGVPYIHFPPYTRNEAISLIAKDPPALQPDPDHLVEPIPRIDEQTLLPIFTQFCATVYDSLIAPTSSISITTFRATCTALWPAFIWPLLSSEPPSGKVKTWDFQRLLIRNRSLFQTKGESILVGRLRPVHGYSFQNIQLDHDISPSRAIDKDPSPTPPLLKAFPTLLLLSCYLASHTDPKVDILLFSRLSSSSKSARTRKNYHKRKLQKAATASFADTAAEKNALKASKKLFDAKSGVGRPFPLERVVAILRAVHPEGIRSRRGVSDSVYRGVSELERLGLVVCVDDGEGEGESLWRVKVSRGWVEQQGERIGLGVRIGEYEVQGD